MKCPLCRAEIGRFLEDEWPACPLCGWSAIGEEIDYAPEDEQPCGPIETEREREDEG